MNPMLRTAATGMQAQEIKSAVIANNLANANTTGFKGARVNFEDLLYQTIRPASVLDTPDANVAPALQVGRGTRLESITRTHQQGAVEQTNRPLDMAIEGDGFFQIQLPTGQAAYTRNGAFAVSDQGVLVTSDGNALVPGIQIPSDAKSISISRSGVVSVQRGDTAEGQTEEVGRVALARFINPSGLEVLGGSLYVETPSSGTAIIGEPGMSGMGVVEQGALEASNVEMVQEMTSLITTMRHFEMLSKAVKTADDMMGIANNLMR